MKKTNKACENKACGHLKNQAVIDSMICILRRHVLLETWVINRGMLQRQALLAYLTPSPFHVPSMGQKPPKSSTSSLLSHSQLMYTTRRNRHKSRYLNIHGHPVTWDI
jgi:hypothetical protein